MALYTNVNPDTNKEYIWGMIDQYDNQSYALHFAEHSKGGHMTVQAISSTIPAVSKREEGMIVFQRSNGVMYKLGSNLTSWTAIVNITSNGLYEYVKYAADSNGVVQEVYKWYAGNLEIFLTFPNAYTSSSSGAFFYRVSPAITFKTRFITNEPVCSIAVQDTAGGVVWGSIADISISSVSAQVIGNASTARGLATVACHGRWN